MLCGNLNGKEIQRRGDLCILVADSTLLYSRNESEVTHLCTTLCDPMDYSLPLSMGFSRQEYWSGLSFPSPGDLPNPGIEPGSPTLQADASLSEPPGKHKFSRGRQNNRYDSRKGAVLEEVQDGDRVS